LEYYQSYEVSPSLKGFVREVEVYHAIWDSDSNLPAPFITCLANTQHGLYFYLRDKVTVVPEVNIHIPAPPNVITGPKYKPVGLLFGQNHLMVKVVFHPTALFRIVAADMQPTVNAGLSAAQFFDPQADYVSEQLRKLNDYQAMARMVIDFLESKIAAGKYRSSEPIDEVATSMLEPATNVSIEELAARACLSIRQFERSFTSRVGLSPKLFIRIVRFESAMKVKNQFPDKSWSVIADECGYTDSSHLLREFKEFAEFPPSAFYLQPTSGHSDFPTG
jgi:AraC-like DNA-binding protein